MRVADFKSKDFVISKCRQQIPAVYQCFYRVPTGVFEASVVKAYNLFNTVPKYFNKPPSRKFLTNLFEDEVYDFFRNRKFLEIDDKLSANCLSTSMVPEEWARNAIRQVYENMAIAMSSKGFISFAAFQYIITFYKFVNVTSEWDVQ